MKHFDSIKKVISLKQQRDHYKKGMILYKGKYLKQRKRNNIAAIKMTMSNEIKLKALSKSEDKLDNMSCTQTPSIASSESMTNEIIRSRKRKLIDTDFSDLDNRSHSKRARIDHRIVEVVGNDSS